MMKTLTIAVLVGISMLCWLPETSAETIKMSYPELKPFFYQDEATKQARGAVVAYFEAVASKMGYTVEWIGPLPAPRQAMYLEQGEQIDAAGLYFRTPERDAYLYYPDAPYYLVKTVFAVRKDNPLAAITSIDDVKGYTIGFVKDVYQSKFVSEHVDQLNIEYLSGTNWIQQNLQKLLQGKLDAVYDLNDLALLYEATLLHVADQIKVLPLPEEPQAIYVVFSKKRERGKILVDKYNAVFQEVNFADFIEQEFESAKK